MDLVWFSELNELPGDVLMRIFGCVKFPDLDAPAVQVPKGKNVEPGAVVYDMELASMVMNIPLLWSVCKQWMLVLGAAIPLSQRVRMRQLITHHEGYVMSQAARFVRALRLAAMHHCHSLRGSPMKRDCVKNTVRNAYIFYPSVRSEVFIRLRAAANDRSVEGRLYRARLSVVVSETLCDALMQAFGSHGCMDERQKQACCYIWSSVTNTAPDRWDPLLHYDHAMQIAKRLSAHPALCTYVTKMAKASTPEFHPNVLKVLLEGCRRRATRRILPMSFAIPTVTFPGL
jgi:hypothetical protein